MALSSQRFFSGCAYFGISVAKHGVQDFSNLPQLPVHNRVARSYCLDGWGGGVDKPLWALPAMPALWTWHNIVTQKWHHHDSSNVMMSLPGDVVVSPFGLTGVEFPPPNWPAGPQLGSAAQKWGLPIPSGGLATLVHKQHLPLRHGSFVMTNRMRWLSKLVYGLLSILTVVCFLNISSAKFLEAFTSRDSL